MTTITPITGNITTTDNRSANDVVYLVSAVYATANSTALNITAGTNVEAVFRNGGSVFNTFGTGAALVSSVNVRLTVEDGSTLSSADEAIAVQAHVLTMINYGTIASGSIGIMGAGNGSSVTNYGEVRAAVSAYSSDLNAGSTINNFGTFRSNGASGRALDLGDLNDTVNNYGAVFGRTLLYAGTDTVFNSGTMRGTTVISAEGGNKTIVNSGLIAVTASLGTAIQLAGGNDTVTNLGQIFGDVLLGDGANTFVSGANGSVTSGTVIGGSGADNMAGGAGADRFLGGSGFDFLVGNGGDDRLNGDGGDDYMQGDTGSDVYVVDSALDNIVELVGQGADTVNTTVSYTLKAGVEVEYLTGAIMGNLTLVGNEFAQTIRGVTGNDTLDGGAGADILEGNVGNDVYVLGAEATGFDTVIDDAGIDTITSTITRSLGSYADVENLTLLGITAVNGTGNGLANVITGNGAANTLAGGADALVDTLIGLAGADTYVLGASANDVVQEIAGAAGGIDTATSTITRSLGAGGLVNVENLTLLGTTAINGIGNGLANIITGSAAANTLGGGLANDTLRGLAGNDVLIGGLGKDTSTGGAGNDIFRFALVTHSVVGANADVITDFDDANDDRIDVSALFGPAMTYRHNLAFTAAGQVRIDDIAGADVIVEINTGGSLAADFAVRLASTTLASMSVGDFIL